jgi:hypothetical protein
LGATPSIFFENVKAFYVLRAAGIVPDEVLRVVQLSAEQIATVGLVPVRVPAH